MIAVYHGDMLAVIPQLVEDGIRVDAVVTDPPYHLTSGNLAVDWGALGPNGTKRPNIGQTNAAGRKGGFMGQTWDGGDIAFRRETWWLISRLLRPGGFILVFGGTRTYHRLVCAIEAAGFVIQDQIDWLYGSGFPKNKASLKPAHEPICVAYKPGGTRALGIDECRIGTDGRALIESVGDLPSNGIYGEGLNGSKASGTTTLGRWPANVIHDGSAEVIEAFAAFGESSSGNWPSSRGAGGIGCDGHSGQSGLIGRAQNSGSAARFFYSAKADGEDRWGSKHPTVKPVELIRYLVKLVCPPDGTFLDPFAGSGTAAVAALAENRNAVLIERESGYVDDIRERIAHYSGTGRHSLAAKQRAASPAGALPLFGE